MNFSVQECRATCKAGHLMCELLVDGGPNPFGRPWLPCEQQSRKEAIQAIVQKLKDRLTEHNRACRSGTRCHRHGVEQKLSKADIADLYDCLCVSHILMSHTDDYEFLKQIRAVLFKVGASMPGAKK